jgi:hypothetical protein
MQKYLTKSLFALLCLAMLSIPAHAQKGGTTSCAAADIQLGNYSASRGNWVGVYGSLQNCSPSKKRSTVEVFAVSACGVETTITNYRSAFNPGENKLYSVVYTIAPNTCIGTSTVTVRVSDGETILTSASKNLTVQ